MVNTLKIHEKENLRVILIGIGISIVLHLSLGIFTHLMPRTFNLPSNMALEVPKPQIKFRQATPEEIRKLRTVGMKDGDKYFSMKAAPKPGEGNKTSANQKLDLKNLSPRAKDIKHITPSKQVPAPPVNKQMSELSYYKKGNEKLIENHSPVKLSQATLTSGSLTPKDAIILNNSDFNIGLVPPEGVPEDQLNSMEKIYYSFQKRTFQSYLNSFITTYHEMTRERPYIKDQLIGDRHQLTGRIVFDSEGNIVTIKILKSSSDDNIHNLFENTLTNIGKLPNPPKSLLTTDQEFVIYFQLNINR